LIGCTAEEGHAWLHRRKSHAANHTPTDNELDRPLSPFPFPSSRRPPLPPPSIGKSRSTGMNPSTRHMASEYSFPSLCGGKGEEAGSGAGEPWKLLSPSQEKSSTQPDGPHRAKGGQDRQVSQGSIHRGAFPQGPRDCPKAHLRRSQAPRVEQKRREEGQETTALVGGGTHAREFGSDGFIKKQVVFQSPTSRWRDGRG
jgi:hypothetical protein